MKPGKLLFATIALWCITIMLGSCGHKVDNKNSGSEGSFEEKRQGQESPDSTGVY